MFGEYMEFVQKFNVLGYEFKGVVDVEYDGNASETEISDSGLENDRTGIVFYEKSEEKGFKKSKIPAVIFAQKNVLIQ